MIRWPTTSFVLPGAKPAKLLCVEGAGGPIRAGCANFDGNYFFSPVSLVQALCCTFLSPPNEVPHATRAASVLGGRQSVGG